MSFSRKTRMQGLSLIELLVALVIAMMLVLGLVEVFSASRAASKLAEGMGRAQENGRFAMDSLTRDIRMAGHFGCVNDQARRQNATSDVFRSNFPAGPRDFRFSIQGYDNASPTGLTLSPTRLTGTDSIVLRFLGANGIPITSVDTAATTHVAVVDPAKWAVLQDGGFTTPTMFGVGDCSFSDVFNATAVNSATGRVTAPAGVDLGRYGTSPGGGPAMLYRAEALVYYIGTGAGGRPSLFRGRISPTTTTVTGEELVEGIENMQLRYGMDQRDATDPSGFIATQATAAGVTATDLGWRSVGQVQVALLAASADPSSSAQRTGNIALLDTSVTPADDGRYRTVYETTIALRNRLYGN